MPGNWRFLHGVLKEGKAAQRKCGPQDNNRALPQDANHPNGGIPSAFRFRHECFLGPGLLKASPAMQRLFKSQKMQN